LSSALAEVNGTPTSTTTSSAAPAATATPAQPGGPEIELLNPSGYTTPVVVSNKGDTDGAYHLVATVANANAVVNPLVEFEISGGVQPVPGSRVGDTDTWHAFWTGLPGDGDRTITAKLFGGDPAGPVPISTDSQAVTINKTRETVEMTYPLNGGGLGTFDPVGPADRGFVIDATVSADATAVDVFYSTSPPGTEPNWRRCAQQVTVSYSAAGNRRIGCTVSSTHFSSESAAVFELRGVAVVTRGTDEFDPGPPPNCTPDEFVDIGPPPLCPTIDSGDAHRVFAYDQGVSSLTLTPPSGNAETNTCRALTATAIDSQQRPVWRANVDVHASGPSDGLQFGRITGQTRDWQPADAAGSHSGTEPTHNCGGTGTPPAQAEHDTPNANDLKHIETKPAEQADGGTDTSGTFTFALRSSIQGPTNLIEVWADNNDNDVRDIEALGTASITWTGPTPSQTASATRSPSTSPSATRSPTTSASATRSPTTSSSASASGSTTRTARTISLETNRNTVKFGRGVVFSGVINSESTACEEGQVVKIQQQTVGAEGFTEVASTTSTAGGAFSISFDPAENANYRAVVDPSNSCQEAISNTRLVLVKVKVGLSASHRRMFKGGRVTFRATVAPCGNHADSDVLLMRKTGRRYKEIGRKQLNGDCLARFKPKITKDASFKARWPSQDDNHEGGSSRVRRVNAVKPPGRRNFQTR
jgi:hypothetical protein